MATTITAATLKITIKEEILLNSIDHGNENILSISSINEISHRIVTLPSDNSTIALMDFSSAAGAGQFITGDVKYIRITNKDDTYGAYINLTGAAENAWIVVDAGKSLIISGASSMLDAVASGTVGAPSVADLTSVKGQSVTSAQTVDLDIYVASA
jgi:hypothetical protein|tara:strand:- start:450 stop:917 length:468 start_codon:yes stop_codon:yes gene_type:complete